MEKEGKYTPEFFEAIAHLMYAIAVSDGQIAVKEKISIKDLIEEHQLLPALETEHKEIIYAFLRSLIKDQINKEGAFFTFKEFYRGNSDLFSIELKKNLIKIADKIAKSYANRNKSEAVIISKLYFLLWK